jgi:hypothetical protein
LGRADGALHAAQGPEQAPAQSQGQAEVIIVFRSNGAICGAASLLPDAPRPDLFASDDGSGGDVDAGSLSLRFYHEQFIMSCSKLHLGVGIL